MVKLGDRVYGLKNKDERIALVEKLREAKQDPLAGIIEKDSGQIRAYCLKKTSGTVYTVFESMNPTSTDIYSPKDNKKGGVRLIDN